MQKSSKTLLALLGLSTILMSACGARNAEPDAADGSMDVDLEFDIEDGKGSPTLDIPDASSAYLDGTYLASGTYQSPAGAESIAVSLTIEGNVVQSVSVTPQSDDQTSLRYQERFADGIAAEVVGVPVDDLDVSVVSGSSLTPEGFNQALEEIKAEARA